MQPDSNTCLSTCPTGYTENSGTCEGTPGKVFCQEFNSKNHLWVDGGVEVGEVSSDRNPLPVYRRGMYFENSYYQVLALQLSSTFTIATFVAPYTGVGSIISFAYNDKLPEEHVGLYIASGGTFSVAFLGEVVNSTSSLSLKIWQHAAVSVKSTTGQLQSDVKLYYNGQEDATGTFTTQFWHEIGSIGHMGARAISLGVLYGYENFYTGFIWDLCIYSLAKTEFTDTIISDSCEAGECFTCPISTCLIQCDLDFYLEEGVCEECLSTCEEGCIRGENCNTCVDPECAQCENWEVCQQCI